MVHCHKGFFAFIGLALLLTLCLGDWNLQIVHAQNQPLTYPEINTALNAKLPNQFFKDKTELIIWLIDQIKQRKVDKPLSKDVERTMRQAGATNQLIDTIKANIAPVPKPTPLQTPDKPANTPANAVVKAGSIRKNSIGMELIYVPPGKFMMGFEKGNVEEKPVHRVTISKGLWMGKYEVTQSQYEAVTGKNPSNFKGCGSCPVERVSWNDVKEFISQLNAKNDGFVYSLPTEAQWEYSARARSRGMYAWKLEAMGWYSENSSSKTHPVGTKKPNAFGLSDMHGNISEWCEDWFGPYSTEDATDPLGPNNGKFRVLRGGSWSDLAPNTRSAYRGRNTPSERSSNVGFRVVARVK